MTLPFNLKRAVLNSWSRLRQQNGEMKLKNHNSHRVGQPAVQCSLKDQREEDISAPTRHVTASIDWKCTWQQRESFPAVLDCLIPCRLQELLHEHKGHQGLHIKRVIMELEKNERIMIAFGWHCLFDTHTEGSAAVWARMLAAILSPNTRYYRRGGTNKLDPKLW
jgi:hypothetical protein